ncbi:MAG: RIP metalloprotease RseP [Planctomycetota bacterium]|jgi:regulator of sigma E protease
MHDLLMQTAGPVLAVAPLEVLAAIKPYFLIFLGFSAVIFVHELGHFLVAKWADVRVEKFCIGFGREIFGFTRGETRYGFNILPLGGYVKMLGQEDFEVDTTGALQVKEDPRSFANKAVGRRMLIVSAGVVMNVVFAALLFMIVFMVGLEVNVTKIGDVTPNSPAALGGLQAGDTVLEINGKRINEFNEIRMAIVLADPHQPLDFLVERDGQPEALKIQPENHEEQKLLKVGISPAVTNHIILSPPGADPEREDLPRPGDKLVEINGQVVTEENANELFFALVNDPGLVPEVWVERPVDPDDENSPTRRVPVKVTPTLGVAPSDPDDLDTINILGFSPLMRFDSVEPDGRAQLAGIRPGDTIIQIGDIRYPTYKQITRAIREACKRPTGPGPEDYRYVERDIPVIVQRSIDRREARLVLRPKVRRRLFKRSGPPEIGGSYGMIANDLLRVGETVAEVFGVPTPAARANIPAGALLTAVDEAKVTTWVDCIERSRRKAGQTVTVAYIAPDGTPASAQIGIPHSLRTKMGLPIASRIMAIDGDETVPLERKGQKRKSSISQWYALRSKLAACVGQTVTVRYASRYANGLFGEAQTAEIEVTEDMIDPWLGRIDYRPNFLTAADTKMLRTVNPIEAIGIGIKKTYYFVMQVYATMKRMIFTRSVGVEHLSGPVGIVKMGSDMAHLGVNRLIFFLAIISANLAVINFLPLPIVDGGLMVFLIIEKIKGTPVSIRTQVVTQVIGLFLIIAAFVFVTFQDLQRIFG